METGNDKRKCIPRRQILFEVNIKNTYIVCMSFLLTLNCFPHYQGVSWVLFDDVICHFPNPFQFPN